MTPCYWNGGYSRSVRPFALGAKCRGVKTVILQSVFAKFIKAACNGPPKVRTRQSPYHRSVSQPHWVLLRGLYFKPGVVWRCVHQVLYRLDGQFPDREYGTSSPVAADDFPARPLNRAFDCRRIRAFPR